jgi:hypothetical protein
MRRPLLRSNFKALLVARPNGSLAFFMDGAGVHRLGTSPACRSRFRGGLAERPPLISRAKPNLSSRKPALVFSRPVL